MFIIDHVGLVVPNIERYLKATAALYEGFTKTDVIVNDTQKVREVFLTDGRSVIELLEPTSEDSPLANVLAHTPQGSLVHICYQCDSIVDAIDLLTKSGAKRISGPTPDVAFNQRPIAFLFMAGQVIELVQR